MDDNSVLQAAEDILGVQSTSPGGTETSFRGGSEFHPNKRATVTNTYAGVLVQLKSGIPVYAKERSGHSISNFIQKGYPLLMNNGNFC